MENSRPKQETWNQPVQQAPPKYTLDNKRVLTGIVAILLGHLGIHKFILGYNTEGFILLAISLVGYATLCVLVGGFILSVTGIITLIEGIIYLTKTDEQFYEMYQVNKKPWF